MSYMSVTPEVRQFDGSFTSDSQVNEGVSQVLNTPNTAPMDLTGLAIASGLTERYIRENRDRLEQCLGRRVSYKDRSNKNRLMFEPEAVDLFKAWMTRKSDDAFTNDFAGKRTNENESEVDFKPEVTTALVHVEDAPVDAAFVEVLEAIVPAPIQDVTITTNSNKAELVARAIIAAEVQSETNEAKSLEAARHAAYERGFNRQLVVVTAEKLGEQEANRFIAENQEISRLERQLAAARSKQGGDAKATTKSRKR